MKQTSISQSYQTGIDSWVNEVDAMEFTYKVNIYPENLLEFTVSKYKFMMSTQPQFVERYVKVSSALSRILEIAQLHAMVIVRYKYIGLKFQWPNI